MRRNTHLLDPSSLGSCVGIVHSMMAGAAGAGTPVSGHPTVNSYVPRILLRHLAEDPEALCWSVKGSVVFVDISGFTKLSEKLAKIGKEGAEQVTDAIEACFTDLLAVAYANDGSLIKFGGDALLLLFEEEDHVASACGSAIWMRRALRDVGRIELPGGAHLQLRMSVGVHTGDLPLLPCGGLASGTPGDRPRVDGNGRDGARRRRRRDPGQFPTSPGTSPAMHRCAKGHGLPAEARAAGPSHVGAAARLRGRSR